jgi:aspartyl-tRNA synthetase
VNHEHEKDTFVNKVSAVSRKNICKKVFRFRPVGSMQENRGLYYGDIVFFHSNKRNVFLSAHGTLRWELSPIQISSLSYATNFSNFKLFAERASATHKHKVYDGDDFNRCAFRIVDPTRLASFPL